MRIRWKLVFTAAMALLFALAVWNSKDLPLGARLAPMVIGVPSFFLCLIQIVLDWRKGSSGHADPNKATSTTAMVDIQVDDDFPPEQLIPRVARSSSWILSFWALTWLVGFRVSIPLFLIGYLLVEAKGRWFMVVGLTAGVCLVIFGLFEGVMSLSLPRGIFRL